MAGENPLENQKHEQKQEEMDVGITYEIDRETQRTMDNVFTYHAPKGDQQQRYVKLRDKAKELAAMVLTLCPASREQSLALTNLEQCSFGGNAAIARNE